MKFTRFEDLWHYAEKVSSEEKISSEEAAIKAISSLNNREYGEVLYYLSLISSAENINIFFELQRSVTDHFVARQEDD
jgi:hypothetical protein